MKWKQLFLASEHTEAYLLRDYLEHRGVAVQLRGADLRGLGGLIPIQESYPSLWVEEQELPLAKAALARWEAESVPSESWTCPCGEDNEGTFGACWRCQSLRPVA